MLFAQAENLKKSGAKCSRRILVVCALGAFSLSVLSTTLASEFIAGADVSALTVLETAGATYADNGIAGDPVDILTNNGVNWYRLRLFVDPTGDDPVAVQDLDYTIALAQRVKATGARLLLDFHYSDTWADPGHQRKPAAWNGLSYSQLQSQVYSYTKSSIEAFGAAGVMPEMVQIGNEISNGMLWSSSSCPPSGANSGCPWSGGNNDPGLDRLVGLLQAGVDGAKDGAGPGQEPLIMIHHDKGAQWSTTQYFFDQLTARDLDFDVIGYSYYPKFHYNPSNGDGDLDDVIANLTNTANKYGKPVVIAEAGFASRGGQFEPDYEFAVSEQGQQEYLQALVDAVKSVPNDLGWGIFWWYAEAVPTNGVSVWEGGRYGLFDRNGDALPAQEVFAALADERPQLAGDADGDGDVDGRDFLMWQQQVGQSGWLSADVDGDFRVNHDDVAVWASSYGSSPSAMSARVSIPEPGSIYLSVLMTMGTLCRTELSRTTNGRMSPLLRFTA